jgi:MoxR-like ATPase
VIGKRDILENLLTALLAGGHVLLEGAPGMAKTHIARTFAGVLGCDFRRIQFTPDLLPVDILGSYVFDQKTSDFKLRKGAIFSNIILIDEINRGTPKTQSGTIEAMQERQVTIEGHTFPLEEPFMVIATRNPLEVEGIYPLIEAQIDRFMFRLTLDYPTAEEERELIEKLTTIEEFKVNQVASREKIQELATYVEKVHVNEDVKTYMETLVRKTREMKEIRLGASPRALIHLYKAAKARAVVEGRDYVIPDDVKALTNPILNHRMWLSREAQTEGLTLEDIVKKTISDTPIPETRTTRPTQ